jgi:hypothetical protein
MILQRAQKIASVEEAKEFLHLLLVSRQEGKPNLGHHFDFDVFLPSIIDLGFPVRGYVQASPRPGLSREEIGTLLMEAAWELCQEGVLRPGPRCTDGQTVPNAYGNGFSLTTKAKAWLETPPRP